MVINKNSISKSNVETVKRLRAKGFGIGRTDKGSVTFSLTRKAAMERLNRSKSKFKAKRIIPIRFAEGKRKGTRAFIFAGKK